jgi:hypothetical protein
MNLGQAGWRWCLKCEGLFFAVHPRKGVCPFDGQEHIDSESGSYMLQLEESPAPGQDGWRWCRKCEGLFFGGHASQGRCPADNGTHDGSESGNYILHLNPPATIGQNDWRWCHKCQGLYFAGHSSGGACPSGGVHENSDSGDYQLRFAGQYLFDRVNFFALYATEFGQILNANQTNGLSALLSFMEQDAHVTDLRWFAYMLATVKHECANRYQPIREFGCDDNRNPVCTPLPGNPRTYGNPVRCPNLQLVPSRPCPAGRQTHTYYGRGYVQLTRQGNYGRLGAALGRGNDFVHRPDDVLDPNTSYQIMSLGMRDGMFTGRRLSDFINSTRLDYTGARAIINPNDLATFPTIAGHAQRFQRILEASVR